ncbi:MAG: C45 family peptidase [Muribaculaceae bacterium]|nr:C45 family peptidase [Muribaculaceae bacterium]
MIRFHSLCIYTIILFFLLLPLSGDACTSAIVSADLNPYGRPLLWKHRDTSAIDNKVEYVEGKDGKLSYVALFNAADKKLEEAWMGMNEAGFAIMNTASYNIKDDNVPASEMDKEGVLMSLALSSCHTVDDFRKLLDDYPRPMGVEANFGVIDAHGDGAFFETNNHSYVIYPLSEAPEGILVRTNYSHSGRPDEGYGFIREANANHLLRPYVESKNVTPELLTENLSRSFYHDLKKRDCALDNEKWLIDQDFIPRYKSTATIVIEGCHPIASSESLTPGEMGKEYIMWTGMGYPPCSEIIPVWCAPDGVNETLRGLGANGHSEMGDIVKKRRDDVFELKKGNKDKYINISKLYNKEGTGYVQTLSPANLEVYRTVRGMRGEKLNK